MPGAAFRVRPKRAGRAAAGTPSRSIPDATTPGRSPHRPAALVSRSNGNDRLLGVVARKFAVKLAQAAGPGQRPADTFGHLAFHLGLRGIRCDQNAGAAA